jgi:hypothetical protein
MKESRKMLKNRKGFLSWPILLIFLLIMLAMAAYYIKPILEGFNDTKGKYINPDVSTEEGMYKVIKNYASEQQKYVQAIELATEFINTEKYANSKYMPEVFYLLFYSQVQKPDYVGAKATIKQYIDLKYKGVVTDRIFTSAKNPQISVALFQMALGSTKNYDDLFMKSDAYLNKPTPNYIRDVEYIKWPGFEDVTKYTVYTSPYYFGWYLYITTPRCNQEKFDTFQHYAWIHNDNTAGKDQLLEQIGDGKTCPKTS